MRSKIYGVGINDADYVIGTNELCGSTGRHKRWVCPYYMKWVSMFNRCYSKARLLKYPTYEYCEVSVDFHRFTDFVSWVNSQPNQDWQNCHLDKDLLFEGNKIYSPLTCVFITPKVNCFLVDRKRFRGDLLLGVTKDRRRLKARCMNPFTRKEDHIGMFSTELEAHKAWQARKHEYACQLAELQEDSRVADALRQRYAPDKDWTNK
jgi:hypothetical protein